MALSLALCINGVGLISVQDTVVGGVCILYPLILFKSLMG